MKKRQKILFSLGGMTLLIIVIYYIIHGGLFVYCSDAYIRAHIIEIAPRVEGHLKKVLVKNNQLVEKGDLLMEIEPYPHELVLNVKKASLKQEKAQSGIIKTKLSLAEKELTNVKSQFDLTLTKKNRFERLSGKGAVSQQDYENVLNEFDKLKNKLSRAKEECEYWRESQAVQMTVIDAMKSQVALAEYHLSQTRIKAPASGYIVNINARPGDFAKPGVAMFGILEDQEWWVKANYKEYMVGKIKPGQKVWITSDLYPFRVFSGEVVNISRAISRSPEEQKIVPYVSPTTDWIRLQRRFQVRIKFLDIPDDVKLRMGADARTLIRL